MKQSFCSGIDLCMGLPKPSDNPTGKVEEKRRVQNLCARDKRHDGGYFCLVTNRMVSILRGH